MADRPGSSKPTRQSPSGAPATLRGIVDQIKADGMALTTSAASLLQKPIVTITSLVDAIQACVSTTASFTALQLESSNLDSVLLLLKAGILVLSNESCPQQDAPTVAVAVGIVVRLSNFLADRPTTPRSVTPAAGPGAARRTAEQDVRTYALILLALLPNKNADMLLPHWPTLFPNIDATKCGNKHPLLTPLLFDSSYRVRSSAVAALTQILQKSHTQLQFASERLPTAKEKNANASYSASSFAQSGTVLKELHEALYFALTARECASSRGLYFSALAPVVSSTPYAKCPVSLQIVGKCLMLPVLVELLSKRDTHDCISALVFLGAILRAKPLTELMVKFLRSQNSESLVDAAVKTVPALEGWKCCVHFARSAPWIVNRHFDFLFENAVKHLSPPAKGASAGDAEFAAAGPAASAKDRAVEALRCLLHFYGFAWESFDAPDSSALTAEATSSSSATSTSAVSTPPSEPLRDEKAQLPVAAPRASVAQKKRCYELCFLPASTNSSVEVRTMAYKCLGQLGEDFLANELGNRRREVAKILIDQGGKETDSSAKIEVLGSIGVLAWKCSSMDEYHGQFIQLAVAVLSTERDPLVRSKAGFVLSNIAGRVSSSILASASSDSESDVLSSLSELLYALCDASALAIDDPDSSVVGHAVRIMCFTLGVLNELDLIMVVGGHEEGYANFCLTKFRALLQQRDSKLRWNAAYAIGEVLARGEVIQCDPPVASECVAALLCAIRQDQFFKVRSRAAVALSKLNAQVLKASGYDFQARIFDDLCHALAACSETQSYSQYKEADQLRQELTNFIRGMLSSSPGTGDFQRVLSTHKHLLATHNLL